MITNWQLSRKFCLYRNKDSKYLKETNFKQGFFSNFFKQIQNLDLKPLHSFFCQKKVLILSIIRFFEMTNCDELFLAVLNCSSENFIKSVMNSIELNKFISHSANSPIFFGKKVDGSFSSWKKVEINRLSVPERSRIQI